MIRVHVECWSRSLLKRMAFLGLRGAQTLRLGASAPLELSRSCDQHGTAASAVASGLTPCTTCARARHRSGATPPGAGHGGVRLSRLDDDGHEAMQSATKLRALAVEDALALDEGVDTSSDES